MSGMLAGMPPDAPDPDDHEHLFQPWDVEQGRRIRAGLSRLTTAVRPCEICGARIDLVTGTPWRP